LLTILVVGTSVLAGCGRSEREQAPADGRRPISVRTVATAMVERAARLEAGGVVAAAETAVVSSRVMAPVTIVAVRAGDTVRAGDVLVRLDARDLTARVQQAAGATRAAEEALIAARSAHAAAAAEHKLAAAWHARIAQLRERNAATAQELDEADARLAAAAARTTAAQANVEQATAQLASMRAGADAAAITESYAVLRAPFDGDVTERFTDPGNLATPGQPLLRIDAAGSRRVDVQVDEARAAYVRPGERVAVLLDDGDGRTAGAPLDGTVVEVARAVAADQRAFTVKVALPKGVTPRTGTFARVRFDGARYRVLVVPESAVRRQGQLTSVFVVRDGLAHIRLVQTGVADSTGTEVVAGLEPGESVVAAPPVGLTDGTPVTLVTSAATGASR
jgi:RND family efflux transporter MFP subunit